MSKNKGTVIQVMGPVLDIRFPEDQLPKLLSAIRVPNGDNTIIAEVAQPTGDSLSLFQSPPPPGNSAMTHQVSCLQLRGSCVRVWLLVSISFLPARAPVSLSPFVGPPKLLRCLPSPKA